MGVSKKLSPVADFLKSMRTCFKATFASFPPHVSQMNKLDYSFELHASSTMDGKVWKSKNQEIPRYERVFSDFIWIYLALKWEKPHLQQNFVQLYSTNRASSYFWKKLFILFHGTLQLQIPWSWNSPKTITANKALTAYKALF